MPFPPLPQCDQQNLPSGSGARVHRPMCARGLRCHHITGPFLCLPCGHSPEPGAPWASAATAMAPRAYLSPWVHKSAPHPVNWRFQNVLQMRSSTASPVTEAFLTHHLPWRFLLVVVISGPAPFILNSVLERVDHSVCDLHLLGTPGAQCLAIMNKAALNIKVPVSPRTCVPSSGCTCLVCAAS